MTGTDKKTPKDEGATIAADEDGLRLDRWFKRHHPALAHGQLQKGLRTGQIRLDGKRAEASTRVAAGQRLRVPPQISALGTTPKAGGFGARPMRGGERLRAMVLFEDEDVVAINKPPGLAVQGGTGLKENLDDTLMIFSLDGVTKPKLVHRLDRDTSGVLLIARTPLAATRLAAAFRERDTRKIYWAVTVGVPKPALGRIDAPLLKRGEKMILAEGDDDPDAKSAATLYRVVESAPKKAAFVALWPLTGRTHQLRVHLASLGTPIRGDRLYGDEAADVLPAAELGAGLHLHARRLTIPHPRRGMIDVVAPLGKEMLKTWRWFQFDAKADVGFDDV